MDEREVASALTKTLVERVGKERFDLWFRGSVRFEHACGTVRILARDSFTVDRLRRNFHTELRDAIGQIFDEIPAIEFSLDNDRSDEAEPVATMSAPSSEPGSPAPQSLRVVGHDGAATCKPRGEDPREGRTRFAKLSSFVVGDGNRVAITAAQSVLERLGAVSPLFVYGPTGCGKTHLLQGIWCAARARGYRRVLYLAAEQFTTLFLEALRGSGLPSFRHKCRNVDTLLIDDVQFFSGKRATLVELQQTIDALLRDGKQLILSADRSPVELGGFSSELVGRLAGGLVCAMQPADESTRYAILRRLAQREQSTVPDDTLRFLAQRLSGDARQLTGAINQLVAVSGATGKRVNRALAEACLHDVLHSNQRVVHLGDIDRAICDVFGLQPKSLQSQRKTKSITHPRMLAMWLARKHTRAVFSEIGQYFGRRSHSTVIAAHKTVNNWMHDNQSIQLAHGPCDINEVLRRIETRLRTG